MGQCCGYLQRDFEEGKVIREVVIQNIICHSKPESSSGSSFIMQKRTFDEKRRPILEKLIEHHHKALHFVECSV